jgi:anti-sigma-K factor RskA
MSEDKDGGVAFGRLSERMDHLVDAVDRMSKMLEGLEGRFVRKDHHDFKVSALEERVATIERQREDERKNGGMLAWWRNVTAVFAGLAVIATVIGVVVSLALRIAGSK